MNYSSDPSKKPPASPTQPSKKAYGYIQEQPPAYVVKEGDGEAPLQITASEKGHIDNKQVPPAPPSRSPIKPWMIATGICLVLGAGFSVFLALNPPTVPPDTVASSEESVSDASTPWTLSTRDREVSVISSAPRYIESYFEGNDLIQIYEEEHVDESGAVTRVRGIMDNNGSVLVPAAFATISPLNANRYVVHTPAGKWGLINRQNEIIYPLEADGITYISQRVNPAAGVILVQKDNRWTIVNLDGKTVGDTIWDGLAFYDDHSIMALSGEQMYLVNYLGQITVELPVVPVACGNYFDGAYVLVHRYSKNGETFGIQDKDGNTILPADYHSVNFLTPHLIIAAQWSPANRAFKDKAYLFDEKGNRLTDRDYNDIHSIPNKQGEHKILIAKHYELEDNGTYNPRHYLLDANGNKILSDDFDSYAILEEKEQVVLYQNRKSITVDFNGTLIGSRK